MYILVYILESSAACVAQPACGADGLIRGKANLVSSRYSTYQIQTAADARVVQLVVYLMVQPCNAGSGYGLVWHVGDESGPLLESRRVWEDGTRTIPPSAASISMHLHCCC